MKPVQNLSCYFMFTQWYPAHKKKIFLRFPGFSPADDFPNLISLMASPAPDSKLSTMIATNHGTFCYNVLKLYEVSESLTKMAN